MKMPFLPHTASLAETEYPSKIIDRRRDTRSPLPNQSQAVSQMAFEDPSPKPLSICIGFLEKVELVLIRHGVKDENLDTNRFPAHDHIAVRTDPS